MVSGGAYSLFGAGGRELTVRRCRERRWIAVLLRDYGKKEGGSMYKKTLASALLVVPVVATLVLASLRNDRTRAVAPPPLPPISAPAPGGASPDRSNQYSPGVIAIHPSLIGTAAFTAATPAFTAADVASYISAGHLFTAAGPGGSVVSKVLFLPARQASARLGGESIGRPDGVLVAYVEVTGPLKPDFLSVPAEAVQVSIPGQPADPDAGKPVDLSRPKAIGIAVFDAHTGNLLLSN